MAVAKKRTSRRKAPAVRKPDLSRSEVLASAEKKKKPRGPTVNIPEGDVRLTANMNEDLHKRLKLAAFVWERTIGEIIEEALEPVVPPINELLDQLNKRFETTQQ